MVGRESMPFDVDQVLKRFPGDAAIVTRLLAESDSFRTACEDLFLAKATLGELEALQPGREAARIAEYRGIVAELENEIAKAVRDAKQAG